MATIVAFAGSNSSKSINYKLVRYTTKQLTNCSVQLYNMANMPFPMYSEDLEIEAGFSNSMIEINAEIQKADGVIISVNEHNGNISAYFKNLLDWLSRLDRDFMRGKKILLMSTSPGKRGAIGAHQIAHGILTRLGAQVEAMFSLPSFNSNFDMEKGITNAELAGEFERVISDFSKAI
jgi:NAD(P)H-dependent FMN reductase